VIIEQAIQNQLLNNAGVAALVGTNIFYDGTVPQDTAAPYINLAKISAPRDYTHDGASGLVDSRFQFSIFSTQYTQNKLIAAAIAGALSGFRGVMGGAGGVTVGRCFYEDETDLGKEPQTLFYHLAVDYKIGYNE